MSVTDIGFTIKPTVDPGAAAKAKRDVGGLGRELDKLGGAEKKMQRDANGRFLKMDENLRKMRETIQKQKDDVDKLARGYESFGYRAGHAMGIAIRGFDGLGRAVQKGMGALMNWRTLIGGSLVGGMALGGARALFHAGEGNLRAERRLRRQFGGDTGDMIRGAAGNMWKYGVGDDNTINALAPIAEAIESTQAGTRLGGKKLTESQAAKVRAQTFATAQSLFARAQAISPDIDSESLGRMLAEAASGPEGFRRLAGTLGLNRTLTRHMVAANEKGGLFGMLRPGEADEFGIKKGQKAGSGSMLNLLFARSGITDKGATAEMATFSGQVRQLGALFENTLGDVGAKALDKLNARFAKGSTLAEKLKAWMESPKGAEFLDKFTSGIVRIVDGIIKIGEKLPAIGSFLDRYSVSLAVLGGATVASRLFTSAADMLPTAGGGGGEGGGIPVKISNVDAFKSIFGAAAIGYAIGTYLDARFGLSDKAGGERKDVSRAFGGVGDMTELDRNKSLGGMAGSLARQVKSGSITRKAAAERLARMAGQYEGVTDTSNLSKFSTELIAELYTGNDKNLSGRGRDIDAINSRALTAPTMISVPITIGAIGIGAGTSPREVAQSLMPHIESALISSLDAQSGNGAGPMSVPQ